MGLVAVLLASGEMVLGRDASRAERWLKAHPRSATNEIAGS